MKRNTQETNRVTSIRARNAAIAFCGLLIVSSAGAVADRGRGSIRAAARPVAPPARIEPRVEPPHPVPEVRREPARVETPRHVDVPVRRDWDDNDEDARRFGGFGHGPPVRFARGERIHDLPARHFNVVFSNHNYFWDDVGIYYEQQPDGQYLVVQPPVGVVATSAPEGLIPIVVGPTTYEYLDGVFYVAQGNALTVVNPPPGIVVPALPVGATQIVANGTVVYQFGGFNYTPSIQGGVTVYTVTPP